ncbi:YheT family hydrolase [Sutterella sp.]|uniref:YheT family hydrolase n=1 Tax=Sutterella sp. TaxID=1981025 RepID=UPI0026E0421E|nr:alpha/beta fold hydrolase [Sutterella sp.]MDO5530651.1 alpha/beta fold hydrolase [Sutterella sp.]
MPLSHSEYHAPSWCPGGHLQTVIPARITERPKVTYRREIVGMPDGDIVAWDWVTPEPTDPKAPVLVHFHGLEGASDSHYAEALMDSCVKRGWRGVVAHFRTCGGLMNLKPRAYFAGDTGDASWVLETVAKRYPDAPRYAVGVSLGGNQLTKCMGDLGTEAQHLVDAAVSICAPIDLVTGSERMSKGVNTLYADMFLKTLKEKLIEKAKQWPDLFDIEQVKRCQTLYDFDDIYTAPVHGYKGAMEYWQKCSAKQVLPGIRVPFLLLNACNDPFYPGWALPGESEMSASVIGEFPREGGHVGFPEGARFPGDLNYLPRRVMRFFDTGS